MAEPKVSVIIPTYNFGRFVAAAVESALNQTFTDLEVIVVDDGSTDDTREVLRPFGERISYLYQENQGVCAARNRGIREARGEFVAFLDSDDEWLPHKLARQVPVLEAAREVGLVHSNALIVDEEGETRVAFEGVDEEVLSRGLARHLLFGNCVICPTVVVRRRCLERVGPFDASLPGCEDWDMWHRIARVSEVAYIGEPLAKYRRHALSASEDADHMLEISLKVLEKIFGGPAALEEVSALKGRALSECYFVYGRTHLGLGDRRKAFNLFKQAIGAYPYRAKPYRYLVRTALGL